MKKKSAPKVQFDDHAIRLGEPAAGYIVVLEYRDDFCEYQKTIDNKLFRTQEEALEFTEAIGESFLVTVKALRWSNQTASAPSESPAGT